ncbi:hypothetical protein LX32DRAFT_204967 [Colletotrichum zoysiae]|uniref:Uncharacterized protein n=1 Tax=Colletotrichum zoysiae TaxID=1216348 RepID=A0AAD9LVM4_9PEZI|nr:hypothetical protein LX32DRAFT_204967 [Colletotrichum zoysiae]
MPNANKILTWIGIFCQFPSVFPTALWIGHLVPRWSFTTTWTNEHGSHPRTFCRYRGHCSLVALIGQPVRGTMACHIRFQTWLRLTVAGGRRRPQPNHGGDALSARQTSKPHEHRPTLQVIVVSSHGAPCFALSESLGRTTDDRGREDERCISRREQTAQETVTLPSKLPSNPCQQNLKNGLGNGVTWLPLPNYQ